MHISNCMVRDLHLAAELGKTLLDRNTELESALQQMYTTNQEQLQEIEYLSKQIELLRQMNEQHAKVYEQLDTTARELEAANQKLVAESKTSQQKLASMTDMIESLQTHVEDLQRQVEEMKKSERSSLRETFESHAALHRFSSLKELYDLRKHFVYDHIFAERITSVGDRLDPAEEENDRLKKTLSMLQTQLRVEKERRETTEQEYMLIVEENTELERKVANLDSCKAHIKELEAQVSEMQQICQSDGGFENKLDRLVPESILIAFKDPADTTTEELTIMVSESERQLLKRRNSETVINTASAEEILNGHEQTCIRRAEAVKQRGISLLNEVDNQYSALQVKYEELLRKCQLSDDFLKHKAVQTSKRHSKDHHPRKSSRLHDIPSNSSQGLKDCVSQISALELDSVDEHQPEYKVLFKEIFHCLRKSKEEINEHRAKYKSFLSPSL
ncbi:cerebellar degeneration-related protein 2 isoform X2 [Protopterus annectens]|uniref:cerebellar degeneration-related protein 2 isoform X2 n=1 Tax=Protopterus annectens TaxID=7888 RepID=UPI001CF9709D|nr:cerebellar degeneration-related protein 2 isoform X2 [Protopterus annectens]